MDTETNGQCNTKQKFEMLQKLRSVEVALHDAPLM